jgi:hypothetical protein
MGRHVKDKSERTRYKPKRSDYVWWAIIVAFVTLRVILAWMSDHADSDHSDQVQTPREVLVEESRQSAVSK